MSLFKYLSEMSQAEAEKIILKKKDLFSFPQQKITSARTSIPPKTAMAKPAVFTEVTNRYGWKKGTINLDLGGGAYDAGTNFLKQFGVKNFIYDPFNRSGAHNQKIINAIMNKGVKFDTVTICN